MFEKNNFFDSIFFQKSPKIFNGSSYSKSPGGAGVRESILMVFDDLLMIFRREKCFFNLSGPISMRNFTANPFLMVSERSGNAKLEKSGKNL